MFPKLRKITLTSGETIDVVDGVTAIVGPNNSGKSLLLGEINGWLATPPSGQITMNLRALKEVTVDNPAPTEDFLAWLGERYPHRPAGIYPQSGNIPWSHYALPNNANVPDAQVLESLNSSGRFGALAAIYGLYLNAGGTRDIANTSASYNALIERPATPVQKLYADNKLEERISLLVKRAFNTPLTVNRYGGSQITLHVGSVSLPPMLPPATRAYLEEISALPQVQEQGDGVKAFIGILLAITTEEYPLLLIDEPETFLHPPQAYLLGQILAEQHDRKGQVVLATHSADIIRGLTSAKAAEGAVSIVRLTRKETANHVAQLSAPMIRELYNDPLIRYYQILDGLFFHGTVLCEADSDCTYYRAAFDSVDSLPNGTPTSSVSLHFTHCGGKARLAKAIRGLQAARVPVACIVDIDFLQTRFRE